MKLFCIESISGVFGLIYHYVLEVAYQKLFMEGMQRAFIS